MARMVVTGDEIDACLSIKTFSPRRARNVAPEDCGRRALAAPPDHHHDMTTNVVRARFGAGAAVRAQSVRGF